MVKIRLKRLGYKKNPFYRIIVINSREKREGKPIVELGYYNPKRKELKLDKQTALEWIKKGAQPTETVKYLIDNSDDEGKLIRKDKSEDKKLSKKAAAKAEAAAKEEPKKEEPKAEATEEAATEEATA
jgi:small subunit ribosomal protein S16